MTPRWDAEKDPTLDSRRSLNDMRYAVFFWSLLGIGVLMAGGGAFTGRGLSVVGGAMVVGGAFAVRQAGRVRRDEIDLAHARAYGAEAGWFVLGIALLVGGAYVAQLGG